MPGPNDNLVLSPAGLIMLEGFEGLRLKAYPDVRGRLTIGYGHTGPEVVPGLVWTQQQAAVAEQEDVCWATRAVHDLVKVSLIQNQFDSLVTFTFNVGKEDFETSTLLHLLNVRDFAGAGQQFNRWIYAGDVISSGLVNRRKTESNMFFLGVAA